MAKSDSFPVKIDFDNPAARDLFFTDLEALVIAATAFNANHVNPRATYETLGLNDPVIRMDLHATCRRLGTVCGLEIGPLP